MARLELAEGVRRVSAQEWNALVGEGSPFLEWEWLASLEEAEALTPETGWLPRPLLAREDGRLVAACPLYVKGHSDGEFVFDWGWAEAAQRAGIRYYPKLLAGVPFTPVSGARLLVVPGADVGLWRRQLAAHLRDLCRANDLSGVHVNFCLPEEIEPLEASGFKLRIGVQYHWKNRGYERFDDYLARFRSKRRNQIRRELRELERQGIGIETLAGPEIPDALFPRLYEIYLSTVEKNPWGRQYLSRRFFELLQQRFRQRLVVVIARGGEELLGGTINVEKGGALYGRYWGSLREVRHLHFNVCYYAAVEYCIRRGLTRFEPGAGGDYKQVRGFDAEPTFSAHFLADPRLAEAVGDYLEGERAEARKVIRMLRESSALKPPIERGAG